MINECVQILWLVTGVRGCTFGISNLKTKDYWCITESDYRDRLHREPLVGFFERKAEDSGRDSIFGVSLQE